MGVTRYKAPSRVQAMISAHTVRNVGRPFLREAPALLNWPDEGSRLSHTRGHTRPPSERTRGRGEALCELVVYHL